MKAINLIPRAYLIRRSRRRRLRAWAGILAVYVPAVVGATVVATTVSMGPIAASAEMVAEADAQLSKLKRGIADASREATEWSRRAEAENAIKEHPRWSSLLAMLARCRGEDVVLTLVDLHGSGQSSQGDGSGGYRLMVEGLGRSQTSVTRYVLELEATAVFDRVTVAEIRAAEFRGEPAAAFRLECALGQHQTPGGAGP
jgi:Tfp pilus assembly protein PilN